MRPRTSARTTRVARIALLLVLGAALIALVLRAAPDTDPAPAPREGTLHTGMLLRADGTTLLCRELSATIEPSCVGSPITVHDLDISYLPALHASRGDVLWSRDAVAVMGYARRDGSIQAIDRAYVLRPRDVGRVETTADAELAFADEIDLRSDERATLQCTQVGVLPTLRIERRHRSLVRDVRAAWEERRTTSDPRTWRCSVTVDGERTTGTVAVDGRVQVRAPRG